MPVPGKEHHWDVFARFQVGDFFVVPLQWPLHDHRPLPVGPLGFHHFDFLLKVVDFVEVLIPARAFIHRQGPIRRPFGNIGGKHLIAPQIAGFPGRRQFLPFDGKLEGHPIVVHGIPVFLLGRNRFLMEGVFFKRCPLRRLLFNAVIRQVYFRGIPVYFFLLHTLGPIIPPEHELDVRFVIQRAHPHIVNAVHEVPRLMRNLPAHGDPPTRNQVPAIIVFVHGQVAFDIFRRNHKGTLGLVRQRIDPQRLTCRERLRDLLGYLPLGNINLLLPFTERIDIVGDVPPFVHARVVGKRGHRRPVQPRRKGAEDILHVVGILPAAPEVPAFVPVRRLDGKAPVVLEVERVPVPAAFHTMTLDTFALHHQFRSAFNGFWRPRLGWQPFQVEHEKFFKFFVLPRPVLHQLRGHERQHVLALLLGENAFPRRHRRPRQAVRNRLQQVHVDQGELPAGRVPDFEGPDIKIPRPRP